MIISLSGQIGSGKTYIGKRLAKKLNYHYICIGEEFKKIAKENKIDLIKLFNYLDRHPSIERKIDRTQKNIKKSCVLDSRLGFYLAKPKLKIYLKAPLDVRVRRIAKRDKISLREAEQYITKREIAERRRYKKLYGIDIKDFNNYDLVIDTGTIAAKKIIKIILDVIKN